MHKARTHNTKNNRHETTYKIWSQFYDITEKLQKEMHWKRTSNQTTIFILKQAIKLAQEALNELESQT